MDQPTAPSAALRLVDGSADDLAVLLDDSTLAAVVDDWADWNAAVQAAEPPPEDTLGDDGWDELVRRIANVDADDAEAARASRIASAHTDHAGSTDAASTRRLLEAAASLPAAQRMNLLDRIELSELDGWEAEELVRLVATVMAAATALQVRGRLALAASYGRLREQAQALQDARDAAARAGGETVPARQPIRDHSTSGLMKIEVVSRAAAESRLKQAADYVTRLPRLFALLEAGEVSPDVLRMVRTETATLDDAGCREVERRILDDLDRTPGEVAARARQAAAAVDPESFDRRHGQARHERRAYTKPLPDGMALLSIIGPAEQVALRWLEIDQEARALRAAGDERTLAQLHCDLLLGTPAPPGGVSADGSSPAPPGVTALDLHTGEVITRPPSTGPPPMPSGPPRKIARTFQGRPVTTVLVMDLATFLGGNDLPALIQGLGPIPASVARELAHGSRSWFRAAVDDSGVVRDYGRLRAPRQDLRDLIIRGRGRLCACGCGQPAAAVDHRQEHQHGGTTDEANLDGLATRCHGEKTDAVQNRTGWTPTLLADGVVRWTSPFGHERRVRPSDLGLRIRPVYDTVDASDADPDPPPRRHDPSRPYHPVLNPRPITGVANPTAPHPDEPPPF